MIPFNDLNTDFSFFEPTGSIHNSLAASRVEHALSEVASSTGSFIPKTGSQQLWMIQAHIWLAIGKSLILPFTILFLKFACKM